MNWEEQETIAVINNNNKTSTIGCHDFQFSSESYHTSLSHLVSLLWSEIVRSFIPPNHRNERAHTTQSTVQTQDCASSQPGIQEWSPTGISLPWRTNVCCSQGKLGEGGKWRQTDTKAAPYQLFFLSISQNA